MKSSQNDGESAENDKGCVFKKTKKHFVSEEIQKNIFFDCKFVTKLACFISRKTFLLVAGAVQLTFTRVTTLETGVRIEIPKAKSISPTI